LRTRLSVCRCARLCARAGVAPSNAWATSEFFRIWVAAEEEFNDPGAGIRFGDEGIARGYGVAAIVALHAPDFRSALAALSRYKSLTCPECVEVEAKGDEAVVRYRWLQATGPVPRLLVDMTMASLRQLARRGTGGKIAPIRLELTQRPNDEPAGTAVGTTDASSAPSSAIRAVARRRSIRPSAPSTPTS